MPLTLSRRAALLSIPAAVTASHALASARPQQPPSAANTPDAWPTFPDLPPDLVRDTVGASHRSLDRVRELVDATPSLANATWDWGFGDFETALGAAAHTGRREIAEYLLSKGARLDIFAAAMLGMTDAVRAMLPAYTVLPLGPHGIPLLAHARAGGDQATEVLALLEKHGGADNGYKPVPLADADRDALLGFYTRGATPADRFEITTVKTGLAFKAAEGGGSSRNLFHLGNREFHPAGAPAVRFKFADGHPARTVIITDGPRTTQATHDS